MTPKITDEGYALQIQAMNGIGIIFSKIVLGNGAAPSDYRKQTGLVNPLEEVGISELTLSENYAQLTGTFSNENTTAAFEWTEVGIFCANPNSTDENPLDDILYAYGHYELDEDTEGAANIPTAGTEIFEINLCYRVYVGELDNITASLSDSATYVTKAQLKEHIEASNPHNITASDVGLDNVPNVATNDQTPTYTEASENSELESGENLSTAFGKIACAIKSLISHISDTVVHITSSERRSWNNKSDKGHKHSAADITSGVLSITRGGTGAQVASEALSNLGVVGRAGKGTSSERHNATTVNLANGNYSFAEGSNTKSSGNYSHAEGYLSTASEQCCHAEGHKTSASGLDSHAEGYSTTASGQCCHAEGYQTEASGANSHAGGTCTIASKYSQTVVGSYNEEAEGYFIVGNGANYTSGVSRSNAFRVGTDGKCYGSSVFNASGADFAEMFEWADGNPDDEDRRGLFVTLDGDKIRLANAGDNYILGVVSAAPTIVGNTASEDWQGRFKTDVFGERLTETVTIPESTDENGVVTPERTETHFILNEDYDDSKEYVPREQRKEWSAVGLVGQLVVTDDGTCKANGYCTVGANGKATQNQTGWRVMKRLDDTHIHILYRSEV